MDKVRLSGKMVPVLSQLEESCTFCRDVLGTGEWWYNLINSIGTLGK